MPSHQGAYVLVPARCEDLDDLNVYERGRMFDQRLQNNLGYGTVALRVR